jgi:hypothetical protein
LTDTPLYAECKAQSKPVNATALSKFRGVYEDERDDDPRCSGLFISLSGFNGPARTRYQKWPAKVRESFRLVDADEITRLITEAGIVASTDLVRHLLTEQIGDLEVSQLELTYGMEGFCWLASLASQGKVAHFTFLDHDGKPFHPELVSELAATLPELAELQPWATLEMQCETYLARLAATHEWIDLGGLAPQVGGELLRLPIDTIFVHLRAEQDAGILGDLDHDELALRYQLEDQGATTDVIERKLARLASRMGERDEVPFRERFTSGEALHHRRLVILGDPGAGKTTLLRYIARTVAIGTSLDGLGKDGTPPYAGLVRSATRTGRTPRCWPKASATIPAFSVSPPTHCC